MCLLCLIAYDFLRIRIERIAWYDFYFFSTVKKKTKDKMDFCFANVSGKEVNNETPINKCIALSCAKSPKLSKILFN